MDDASLESSEGEVSEITMGLRRFSSLRRFFDWERVSSGCVCDHGFARGSGGRSFDTLFDVAAKGAVGVASGTVAAAVVGAANEEATLKVLSLSPMVAGAVGVVSTDGAMSSSVDPGQLGDGELDAGDGGKEGIIRRRLSRISEMWCSATAFSWCTYGGQSAWFMIFSSRNSWNCLDKDSFALSVSIAPSVRGDSVVGWL